MVIEIVHKGRSMFVHAEERKSAGGLSYQNRTDLCVLHEWRFYLKELHFNTTSGHYN